MSRLLDAPILLFAVVCAAMWLLEEAGYLLARTHGLHADPVRHEQLKDARDGLTLVLSLLLGFTLAMALPRYDTRRELVLDEANALGAAALRTSLLPETDRVQASALIARYTRARLAFLEADLRGGEVAGALAETVRLQNALWQIAARSARASPTPVSEGFVQALNDTFDLSEKQLAALENRLPPSIWLMLLCIAALAAFAAGMALRLRLLLNLLLLPVVVGAVLALIADLDSPRSGLIQIGLGSMQRLASTLPATAAP